MCIYWSPIKCGAKLHTNGDLIVMMVVANLLYGFLLLYHIGIKREIMACIKMLLNT